MVLNNSKFDAMFVSGPISSEDHISVEDADITNLPTTAGANALIRIFNGRSGLAIDLTKPTIPCFEAAYIGAIGKGYSPAFEAVQTMRPLDAVPVFLAI